MDSYTENLGVARTTLVGNWIFAAGGDASAAKNVGVPVKRVKVSLFMFTALCAWLFAMLQICDIGSAAPVSPSLAAAR